MRSRIPSAPLALTLLTSAAVVHALSAQTAAPAEECYRLEYAPRDGEQPGDLFAGYVALAADSSVRSGMGPGQPQRFWNMFLVGGTWARRPDTLTLSFSNGFSSVEYRLVRTAPDALHGETEFLYDVVGESPPPYQVTAYAIPCPEAHLQSPRPDPRWRAERRHAERLEQLRMTEAERLRRQPSILAGTYRFRLQVDATPPIKVYGRTDSHPMDAVWDLDDHHTYGPMDTSGTERAEGYRLRVAVSRSAAALPQTFDSNDDESNAALAYFLVSKTPAETARWRGHTDVLFAISRLTADSAARAPLLRASRAVSAVWFDEETGRTDGWFMVDSAGVAHVELIVVREGKVVLSLQGTRITEETLGEAR